MTIVIIGQNYWSKGKDLAEAKKLFRSHGGTLGKGYTILEFGPNSEFIEVNWCGDVLWTGERPTVTQSPVTRKR